MATRVAVFIDWQNTYKSAREAFSYQHLPSEHGNYSPYRIAKLIAAGNNRGADGELKRVFIYRGLPNSNRDPLGYGANRRQSAAWMRENPEVVIPRLRPLRYPQNDSELPVEKGIDVELAISAVETVMAGKCDVAVIFSNDTDLLPAAEAIIRLKGQGAVETASWVSDSYHYRLRPQPRVFHHFLHEKDFISAERCVNYAYAGAQEPA